MANKRDELIKNALMDKLSGNITIYSADDILTAADITDEETQDFQEKIRSEIARLAKKKKS